jgi:hypothetical protein
MEDVSEWRNPRPPAVPGPLRLDLREYFTAAALIGFLAAQKREPDKQFAAKWTAEMGRIAAADVERMRRRRTRRRRKRAA